MPWHGSDSPIGRITGPRELSGGERQRVAVARAIVNDPAIVWADEPTGALDSKTATEIIELLRALNRDKRLTFVLVTHDGTVGARCDRIVRMHDGQIELGEPVAVAKHNGNADLAGTMDESRPAVRRIVIPIGPGPALELIDAPEGRLVEQQMEGAVR